ncbi:MAG: hypothetical protein AABW59_04175 [archaeon]
MDFRNIEPTDYSFLLELDKKVYPTLKPVNAKIISGWYRKNPEFGMIAETGGKIVGVMLAIPLNKKGWTTLTTGKLSESETDEQTLFNNKRDKEIGIHVYHIENLDKETRKFYLTALEKLKKLLLNLRKTNKELKVIGFSGLCVTNEGIGLFEEKLGCHEKKFKSEEYILEKKGIKSVFELKTKKDLTAKTEKEYSLITRCKMLVATPKDKSIVWRFFE